MPMVLMMVIVLLLGHTDLLQNGMGILRHGDCWNCVLSRDATV